MIERANSEDENKVMEQVARHIEKRTNVVPTISGNQLILNVVTRHGFEARAILTLFYPKMDQKWFELKTFADRVSACEGRPTLLG